jgi:hypothetical protein
MFKETHFNRFCSLLELSFDDLDDALNGRFKEFRNLGPAARCKFC